MAKELPFFKFEPSQWENGTIQICSFEQQGLFINLCSMYWQRLGDLPYKLAVQKICGGNASALDSLCEADIIKVIDGMICIDFLNEQLSEFEHTSKVNSKNARDGWEKRRKEVKNATAMRPHSDRNATPMPEEKRRVEESRQEEINTIVLGTPSETTPQFKIKRNYLTDKNYIINGEDGYIKLITDVEGLSESTIDKRNLAKFMREKNGAVFEGSPSFVINSFKLFVKNQFK